ncbi:hypothetical protein BD410DRAFT_824084 [Rickenella mellea]|uniref:DUF6535 domain-containing protein n=1 Tax=Rickenella mellea TaxID=50990 RepID=A0A4R5XHT3_9AGAM|nr:hypothetical protein BD410DRAFT_824084 [Rickenella mellea]
MATLLRRRDERDQANDAADDVDTKRDTTDGPPVVSPDTSFEDPGSKIWLPYLGLADKYDKDLVHNWRDDMDSLLIFAALFSASVTAFVIESYNSLVQDPGEVTISVLLQISQQIANGTQSTAAVRPSFQPATIDVAINILWFLSLAFSLTCALAAVLVRQWARQYLRYPRSFSATSEQARARQFVFENMQWWKMDVVVDMIPALLHISLILFFIGLLLFVRAVSYPLAVYLLCFSAIGGAAYSLLTTLPLIFSACPYKTPFTGFFGLCITTLLRPMWRCTIVLMASLEIYLLQLLSPVIRVWFPSFSILEWKVALKLSGPVRLAIARTRTYLREKRRLSLKDILSVTRNIGSTVTIFQTCFQRCYQILHERREEFHDDLTIRDAHALRWTMEYCKRDTDLFTIITSVPEFVQLYLVSHRKHFVYYDYYLLKHNLGNAMLDYGNWEKWLHARRPTIPYS